MPIRSQMGMGMVQVLIALGVGGILIVSLGQLFTSSNQVKVLVRNADILIELEERVRQAAMHQSPMLITAQRNKNLRACLVQDEVCATDWTNFDLWLFKNDRVTGSYEYSGAKCSGSCPIEVKTRFAGVCEKKPCSIASLLHIEYRISIQGTLVRQGVVSYTFEAPRTSDENIGCSVDDKGRPKFAKSISRGSVNCLQVPEVKSKLKGIDSGECARASGSQQVLVGFNPAGKLICEKAKFSE